MKFKANQMLSGMPLKYTRGVLLRFVLLRLKSYKHRTLLEITRQIPLNKTNFWKVLRQINAYVLNKWLLKFQCAYLNTQGSSPSDTPLKRIDDG
ncbi:hypothetical protein T06_7133 [Trichinella sp. T6]|nr:hypothetical protein T06_7133 [Trichinella sp. T6]